MIVSIAGATRLVVHDPASEIPGATTVVGRTNTIEHPPVSVGHARTRQAAIRVAGRITGSVSNSA